MTRQFYCWVFALLLATEVCIALFVHDALVRPYLGDVLVIILLYCLCRGVLGLRGQWLAPAVTALGILAECLQYFRLADRLASFDLWSNDRLGRLAATWLGLGEGSALRIILGNTFDWKDLLCYLAGGLLLLGWERAERKEKPR